jgi:hypothetical protein
MTVLSFITAQPAKSRKPHRQSCPWAAVYYEQLRTRGKNHACALRSLGQRWLKILWKMWQTGTRYDAELHARNQLKHGSWVLKIQHA